VKPIVATHEGCGHNGFLAQVLLKQAPWPGRPLLDLERMIRPVLPANPSEELVQVVNDPYLSHHPSRPPVGQP
jgi:hypothetical protein